MRKKCSKILQTNVIWVVPTILIVLFQQSKERFANQYSSHWLFLLFSGSLLLSLAHSPALALFGSLWLAFSLWLSLALSCSLWLPLALSAILWCTLALSDSLFLSFDFDLYSPCLAHKALARLTRSLLGS